MAVTVRRATRIDAPAIARMSLALVEQHHGYDAERFARIATIEGMERFYGDQTENENARVLVAEIDEKLVGFAYMVYEPRNYADLSVSAAKLHDIYVYAGERGTGIGRALVIATAAVGSEQDASFSRSKERARDRFFLPRRARR